MSSSTFPATGVAVTPGTVAPVGGRVAAFLLDGVVAALAYGLGVGVALVLDAGQLVLPLLLVVVVGVGQWIAESFTGATVGGWLLGYRTVAVGTGRPAGLLAILLRQLVVAAGAIACFVGQLVVVASGAWDHGPAQRGWHDKAAGTLVLRASALRPRKPGGPGAWNQAVERAVGSAPPPSAPRPLPVVPPMPVPVATAPQPQPQPEPEPVVAPAPARPRGGAGRLRVPRAARRGRGVRGGLARARRDPRSPGGRR